MQELIISIPNAVIKLVLERNIKRPPKKVADRADILQNIQTKLEEQEENLEKLEKPNKMKSV